MSQFFRISTKIIQKFKKHKKNSIFFFKIIFRNKSNKKKQLKIMKIIEINCYSIIHYRHVSS